VWHHKLLTRVEMRERESGGIQFTPSYFADCSVMTPCVIIVLDILWFVVSLRLWCSGMLITQSWYS
jgi:hypothetical protein